MKENNLLERIVIDSKIMAGKPVIKGTRLTVQLILSLLSQGIGISEILDEYNNLKKEDIMACLLFASKIVEDSTFMPLESRVI